MAFSGSFGGSEMEDAIIGFIKATVAGVEMMGAADVADTAML